MTVFCNIAGILCLLYLGGLLFYSGLTSAFYFIWLILSAGFFFTGWLFHIHFWQMLPAAARMALLAVLACCVLFFLSVEAAILKGALSQPAEEADYVIVLGAHVRSTGPSKALALRLDKALEYAADHPDTIFVVSGGQGSNEPCTEAEAMCDYLTARGMDASRILLEEKSTNTRENIIFSQKQIPDHASVGIISNGFHITRALHLARTLGIEDPIGIPAKSDLPTQPNNLLREFFALVKDYWLVR